MSRKLPLTAADIPPGTTLRQDTDGHHGWRSIDVHYDGIYHAGNLILLWTDLIDSNHQLIHPNGTVIPNFKESPVTKTGLQPHQQRVVDEKNELEARAKKLSDFISHSPLFKSLDPNDKWLLQRQRTVMAEYLDILHERIAAFQDRPPVSFP